ncbi:MAG: hypothetical protein C4K58_02880 [Flavobacteriaceae bacterium]|nr:MAG: hypothetical protein C4K58_02880 [Flavobacteriaceae bacterium]
MHKLISLLLWLYSICLFAQKVDSKDSIQYHKKYPEFFFVRSSLESDKDFFVYSVPNFLLNVEQNNVWRYKFNFNYGNLGLGFGYSPDFLSSNTQDGKRGISTMQMYEVRFLKDHWMQELYLKRNTGYFVRNSEDFRESLGFTEPFYLLPQWKVYQYGTETWYVLNPNFSIQAMYNQNIHQIRSAGSWVFGGSGKYQEVDPGQVVFDQINFETKEGYLQFNTGYFHSQVMHFWYINGFVYPGLGFRYSNVDLSQLDTYDLIRRQNELYVNLRAGTGFGFQDQTWLFGCQVVYEQMVLLCSFSHF